MATHSDIYMVQDNICLYNVYMMENKKIPLSISNPELLKEWDYEKNVPLTPDEVTASSSRMIWWMCSNGHKWQAVVYSRKKSGCPYCSNRKVLAGYNDLATTNPDLVNEWNYGKNTDVKPETILGHSSKKVWWKCSLGHEWKASVSDRSTGKGCPFCRGQRVLIGYNDLATRYPQIAKEWSYEKNTPLTPYDVTAGSGIKVWWRCSLGHEWQAVINNRVSGTGCPICSGKKVLTGFNDFASKKPALANEWNYEKNSPLLPTDISFSSGKKVWWVCSRGHDYQMTIDKRYRDQGCPYCSNRKVLVGYNDLATTNPILATEWNTIKNSPLTIHNVTMGSNKKVWWICSMGHEWQETICNRNNGFGCPYCSGHRVSHGFNDLSTIHPELINEWDFDKNIGVKPSDVSSGSAISVWWKCSLGHEWQSIIVNRVKGSGCPYCANKAVLSGFNDLATTNPDLANEWNYEKNKSLTNGLNGDISTPDKVTAQSQQKVWWKCKNGHEWQAAIYSRSNDIGCPYCSGKVAIQGKNDLVTTNPDLAKEWNYEKNKGLTNGIEYDISTPNKVTSHSKQKVWWICEHGHEWQAVVYSRTEGSGCPYCSSGGTSKPEQGIAYYLSSCCRVEQRIRVANKEIDIYLPEYKIGIEYDGSYYHQDKEKDKQKTEILVKEGITLFRVIESNVNKVQDRIIYYIYDNMGRNYEWALETLFEKLSIFTGQMTIGTISVDIKRDIVEIRKRYSLVRKNNSFASKHPELIKEWNYKKNGILTPEMVSYGSNDRVWWICSKGHEWESLISNRSRGYGCPYCDGQKAIKGENDLATINPKLAEEWNYARNGNLTPHDIKAKSNKKVWWKCTKGHEWQAAVYSRYSCGCPQCAGLKYPPILCVETGQIFKSLKEAAKNTGANPIIISKCCKGQAKTSGGFHWQYVN